MDDDTPTNLDLIAGVCVFIVLIAMMWIAPG